MSLEEALERALARTRGADLLECELGSLKVSEGLLWLDGDDVAVMDELAWSLFAKLLSIPQSYLDRLGGKMKELNVNYWLQGYHDKEVVLVVRDRQLVEVREGAEVRMEDVLAKLFQAMPDGEVVRAFQLTNATALDIVEDGRLYEHRGRRFAPGLRAVVKEGLNAPEVSPMLVDVDTCCEVEFCGYFDKLSIKSLGYADILRVIGERVCDCVNVRDHLFEMYRELADEQVVNPRRRVALYCREHALSDRVRSYALEAMEEAGLSSASYGDIIALFGTLGFMDEVKQSSERKLQGLAGHIIVQSHREERCAACDSLAVEI